MHGYALRIDFNRGLRDTPMWEGIVQLGRRTTMEVELDVFDLGHAFQETRQHTPNGTYWDAVYVWGWWR